MVEPGPVRLQDEPNDAADTGERINTVIPDPLPRDALDINVAGRRLTGPDDGFGKLWRKRFQVSLAGTDVTPGEVIRTWRERFGEFWPEGNRFYRPLAGIEPGEVALTDLAMPAGTRLSTGVVVAAVDERSFTFITPLGHMLAGTITFSTGGEAGGTVARVETLMRASDPLYEIGMPLVGHRHEERFWIATLTALARHFGVQASPQMTVECLDRRRKWRNAANVFQNAFLRTAIYVALRPLRVLTNRLWRRGSPT